MGLDSLTLVCESLALGSILRLSPCSVLKFLTKYDQAQASVLRIIVSYILMANLPQTIISFLYLTYNGLFTCMITVCEWARYAIKRASLHVTIPRPDRRSTCFLQLPYTRGFPLLISSILLYWFISQSIFLVRIAVYKMVCQYLLLGSSRH